jgi:hypothetical protein
MALAPNTGVLPTTRAVPISACCSCSVSRAHGGVRGELGDLQPEQQRAQGDGGFAPRGGDDDGAGGCVDDALQLLHARRNKLSFHLRHNVRVLPKCVLMRAESNPKPLSI